MFGLIILSLASIASTGPIEVPTFVQPEVAASQVAACSFKHVRPSFDEMLQEDVITVSDMTTATGDQLRCVAKASLGSHYYVVFPEAIDSIYQPVYWRLSEERELANAKAWLEKRGLLARLPAFDPKTSDPTAVAHTLEVLCGPKAVGTLKPMKGLMTLSDGALTSGGLDDETFVCLLNVATASGYPLGFIGNEAYSKDH